MRKVSFFILYFIAASLLNSDQLFSMNSMNSFYDSDSEDESDYEYEGYDNLEFFGKEESECVVFYRGIHFATSIFEKEDRSKARKNCKAGEPIFSLATYDLAEVKCTNKDEKIKKKTLVPIAEGIKRFIMRQKRRDYFQERYSNNYNKFIWVLKAKTESKLKKNPQVSTSESFTHAGKYAFGKKFFCDDFKKLKPEYDMTGKPKHPYLGKIYVILVDVSNLEKLNPYFVVHGHANKKIKISNHFSNNILSEREVSFPGFIPGCCVVFEKAVRLPSFAGEYRKYYEQKYGMTKKSFENRKGKLRKKPDKTDPEASRKRVTTVNSLIEKVINHMAETLQEHVEEECSKNGVNIVYRGLGDGFVDKLPDLEDAKKKLV